MEINSVLNVGTNMKVSLRLPIAQASNVDDDLTIRASTELAGLTASIQTAGYAPDTRSGKRAMKVKESMEKTCREFKIHTSSNADGSVHDVDLVLTDTKSLDRLSHEPSASRVNKKPLCVVCICTDTAEKTTITGHPGKQLDALGWIVEAITQP